MPFAASNNLCRFFSTENRQSYLILNFAEHTETGDALIVYQEVYIGKIRCGLLETFMAKTELLLANNFCFSQACITLGEKHKFYPGDIVRHFKRETINEQELSSGKYLYEIMQSTLKRTLWYTEH